MGEWYDMQNNASRKLYIHTHIYIYIYIYTYVGPNCVSVKPAKQASG